MRPAVAVLMLFLLAVPVPAQDESHIRALLQKLDDDSIEVRAAAAVELATLGRAAVPLMKRVAADSGPERRDRLAEIIRKIEDRERLAALLPPPSFITLDAKNRPLREVFQALGRQSRTPIDLTGIPEDARVTVSLQKLPYWKALEEICRASGKVMATADNDHIAVTAEPYVALPQMSTDLFHVSLQRIDLSSNGTLGQADRFDHFNAMFNVSWEKGARPWRVSARITELVDEKGDELTGSDTESIVSSIGSEAIHQELLLDDPHGPGPQATKLSRLKVEITFEFPLRTAEVRLPVSDGKLPPPAECPEFSVRINRMERKENALVAALTLTLGAKPPEGELMSESIILRDRKGNDHPGTITEGPQMPENETTYEVSFADVPETGQLQEIVIRIPAEVHREKLEVDLKDIPLK